jgi:hypothetical protein
MHAEPTERGQGQDGCPPPGIRGDQEVAAVVVTERELGQAHDDVPVVLPSPVLKV